MIVIVFVVRTWRTALERGILNVNVLAERFWGMSI